MILLVLSRLLGPHNAIVPGNLVALHLAFEAKVVKAITLTKLSHLQSLFSHGRMIDDH
eukprot:Skav216108  [mRNA]  locus=scaffold1946:67051:67224:- [translate_table: standard]